MRHRKKQSVLGSPVMRKRQILRSQAITLIEKESMITTLTKAKALRPFIERMVTTSRANTLASRRRLFKLLQNENAVTKLLTVLGKRYGSRPGGYTRIIRVGKRQGDNAIKAKISFIEGNDAKDKPA